jgi:hypothetical protein
MNMHLQGGVTTRRSRPTMLRFANFAAALLVLWASMSPEAFVLPWPQGAFLKLLVSTPLIFIAWLLGSALALGAAPSRFVIRLAMFLHGAMMLIAPLSVLLALWAVASGKPGLGVAIVAVAVGSSLLVLANHREFVRRGLWRGLFVAKADKPGA